MSEKTKSIDQLIIALKDGPFVLSEDSSEQIEALVQIGTPAVPQLIAALAEDNHRLRGRSAIILGHIGDPRAAEALAAALKLYDQSSGKTKDSDFRNLLAHPQFGSQHDENNWVRSQLGNMESDTAAQAIQKAIQRIHEKAQESGLTPTASLPAKSKEQTDTEVKFPQLRCPNCKRVYSLGVDASIVTMGTVAAHSAAVFSLGNAQSNETSTERPALVGKPRGKPEYQKQLIDTSPPIAESIRKSLVAGRKEYWYCRECNQNPPIEFPKSWGREQAN